jgi:hypothetical protein
MPTDRGARGLINLARSATGSSRTGIYVVAFAGWLIGTHLSDRAPVLIILLPAMRSSRFGALCEPVIVCSKVSVLAGQKQP